MTRLTDEQLIELLSLTRGADSVELKLSVDASRQRSAVQELGLDPLEAQVRLVHFFDTPDLALERALHDVALVRVMLAQLRQLPVEDAAAAGLVDDPLIERAGQQIF